jgi:hypothetical protein
MGRIQTNLFLFELWLEIDVSTKGKTKDVTELITEFYEIYEEVTIKVNKVLNPEDDMNDPKIPKTS